jgi:hypothetical protein
MPPPGQGAPDTGGSLQRPDQGHTSGASKAHFSHYRIRRDRVDGTAEVTLRYEGKLIHLGVGRAHQRQRVLLLVADRDVRVLSEQGELLSHLTIDPTKRYQRQTRT